MVQHYVQFLFIYLLEIQKYFHITMFPGLIAFRCEFCVCCAVLCILLFSICMTLRLGLLLFPLDTHSSFPYWFCCLFMPVCFFFSFLYLSFLLLHPDKSCDICTTVDTKWYTTLSNFTWNSTLNNSEMWSTNLGFPN